MSTKKKRRIYIQNMYLGRCTKYSGETTKQTLTHTHTCCKTLSLLRLISFYFDSQCHSNCYCRNTCFFQIPTTRLHKRYPTVHVVSNLTNQVSNYCTKFRYVEVCLYLPSLCPYPILHYFLHLSFSLSVYA